MRFSAVAVLGGLLTTVSLSCLIACGGGAKTGTPVVASITISPTTLSLNEGAVGALAASARNSAGNIIAADITFTSSNPNIATISTGGLVCGGKWDTSIINCNATPGQAGVGQVTITATSGGASATATVYVHLQVDRVVVNPLSGCTTMGQAVNATASAFNTSAPGCSPASPCDITSTVGPITFGSNDLTVVANSAGIEATYSPVTNSPTYTSGGTITGSTGQTCNLSDFGNGGGSGIDPTFSLVTNSPTYTSGGTITGSTGQTCNLSNFNGVNGATASVALTGTNTIASGSHLLVTAEGSGGTTPPTTATLSNGTATCSGTANVITALIPVSRGTGVIGAMASVALTGSNTIASGSRLNVTASGYGGTTAPTTATLSNGTATCSGTANVITALTNTNNILTAQNPGLTTVFGSVSGVNGVGVPYTTCPVASILVHDANSSNTSFTLAPTVKQTLTAEVFDTAGQPIKPTLTWASSINASVTVSATGTGSNPGTVTAVAPGAVSITATCSSPDCNINVPAQYSQNVVNVSVTGTTTTTVYAASTNSLSLVPISTNTNSAGTAITLPQLPNSMVINPAGTFLYLGSASGLMVVNLASNAVTALAVNGSVVAISPNGNYVLVSDSVTNNVYSVNVSNSTFGYTSAGFTTASGVFTPDSKYNEWLSGNQLAFGLPTSIPEMLTLPYTANALNLIAEGALTYITSGSGHEIDIRSTCNQSEVQSLAAGNPTLVQTIPNGGGAVAADSPAIDVISTPASLNAGCPVTTQSSLATHDLGAGAFNAKSLFLSPDSSAAWIISDLPSLLTFNLTTSTPAIIPFAGGATPLSGGIRLDGQQIYIGASDGTVHRIDVVSLTDAAQITVGLKDGNGNVVAPNLVYVQPH